MQTPPTNRVAQLAVVPEDLRLLVEERLKLWDALTPDIQTELRTNELMIRHLGRPPLPPSQFENDLSPALRQKLNQQLGAWLLLPLAKRQRMCDRFERFFDLPSSEKEKTLGALSDTERREMENTLKAFEKLPSEQRHVCVNSFRKFANMTSEE